MTLDKLTSTEIYSILISRAQNKPSSNIYFENLYNDYNIGWTAIRTLSRLITNNTYMRSFQYKILKNVLFPNKKLHTFEIKPSPLCSFCNLFNETPYHMFYECDRVKCLWSDLVQCFQNNLTLPTLTPQTTIFGFENNKSLSNHILLILKLYVYKFREKKVLNIRNLIAEIQKIKIIEKETALPNSKKTIAFTRKWHIIGNIVP